MDTKFRGFFAVTGEHMPLIVRKNKSPKPPAFCALTQCLEFLKGAWAPNVIWHLREGPRRFNELRVDIPPISAKVLSTRLSELQERRMVIRKVVDTSPPSVEYELTDFGREILPALDALVKFGHKLKTSQDE